jgi:hypothetical protein
LFGSPKLLKKLSTPKYQKERHLEKRDVKVVEDKKPGKLFLNSPRLARAIFGYKKGSETTPEPTAIGPEERFPSRELMNRSSSESSMASGTVPRCVGEKPKPPPPLSIAIPGALDSYGGSSDLPLTPETPRKPTMGVAMIRKRRASNVSSDRSAIDVALQQHNCSTRSSPFNSSASPASACETPDTEEEWAHIVRTVEQAGLSIEGQKGETVKQSLKKPLDDEETCHLVLSLRALQRTLKEDKQTEIEAIDDLLKEPITLEKLQKWLQKHPHLLP